MVSPDLLKKLADAVSETLSPDQARRTAAEQFLNEQQSNSHFPLALLQLSATDSLNVAVRQAAAVYLKNFATRYYGQENWPDLPAEPRDALKSELVSGVLLAPIQVRRQLSAVLSIIAEHEYPDRWANVVLLLNQPLTDAIKAAVTATNESKDPASVMNWAQMQGALESLTAVFERYPNQMRSNELFTEINCSLKDTMPNLLHLLPAMGLIMGNNLAQRDPNAIATIVGNTEMMIRIFYLLSWQDLPAFVEDNMKDFMNSLQTLLKLEDATIDAAADDEPSCIDLMHASIVEVFNLYAGKYDEEFRPYLQVFVKDIWELLVRRSNASKYDKVVTTGIKFLTTVSRSADHVIFKDENVLTQVCNSIVLQNIQLREEDKELFEDNPVEYIRLDIEGSDSGTRRRGAVELVKGLCRNYESQVTKIFSGHVSKMLAPESSWEHRDAALYVVTALGWKSGTTALGATETSSLINVVEFFNNQVLPELTNFAKSPQSLSAPIFTADLIKYVVTFRVQIPKSSYGNLIQLCAKLLESEEPVVKTYAAICIERLMQVKDTVLVSNGATDGLKKRVPRMTKDDLKPVLQALLPVVVKALSSSRRADEYLMRLILRFCTVSQEYMAPYCNDLIGAMVQVLEVVIKSPEVPLFNHYLFETLSAIIRFNANPNTISAIENALNPPLRTILVEDITDFVPYVFQILSHMMTFHKGPLPDVYKNYIPALLEPSMWEKKGYVPGMVQYVEVYVRKNSAAVLTDNQLEPILGIFHKLVASKTLDHLGLRLLSVIFETYDASALSKYVRTIFNVLLLRLTKAKTPKYVKNLLYCLSVFVLKFGPDALHTGMETQQAGVLAMLLEQVWIPEVVSILQPQERRVCALALADIACVRDLCCAPPYLSIWPRIITATIALAENYRIDGKQEDVDDEDESISVGAGESYSASHSQLQWGLSSKNYAAGVRPGVDPKQHLVTSIGQLTSRHPGRFASIIRSQIEDEPRQILENYLTTAGVSLS